MNRTSTTQTLFPLQFPHMTFSMMSPWETLGDHSKNCIVNTGYPDALWIKPRTLVTVLTNVVETLKSKSGTPKSVSLCKA